MCLSGRDVLVSESMERRGQEMSRRAEGVTRWPTMGRSFNFFKNGRNRETRQGLLTEFTTSWSEKIAIKFFEKKENTKMRRWIYSLRSNPRAEETKGRANDRFLAGCGLQVGWMPSILVFNGAGRDSEQTAVQRMTDERRIRLQDAFHHRQWIVVISGHFFSHEPVSRGQHKR